MKLATYCFAAFILSVGLNVPVLGQSRGPAPEPEHMPPQGGMAASEMKSRADHRFPQTVRVGTLVGRQLLAPHEWQPVLGRVVQLVRHDDGSIDIVVRIDGWLGLNWLGLGGIDWWGFGSRQVSVPVDAVALVGEYVGLMDLTTERLRALPAFAPGSSPEIAADETIRVGLVAPFH